MLIESSAPTLRRQRMFRSALHLRLLRSSGPGILGISGPMTGWWLVVWNKFYDFPYIGNFIIPPTWLILFRGVETTNQMMMMTTMMMVMMMMMYATKLGLLSTPNTKPVEKEIDWRPRGSPRATPSEGHHKPVKTQPERPWKQPKPKDISHACTIGSAPSNLSPVGRTVHQTRKDQVPQEACIFIQSAIRGWPNDIPIGKGFYWTANSQLAEVNSYHILMIFCVSPSYGSCASNLRKQTLPKVFWMSPGAPMRKLQFLWAAASLMVIHDAPSTFHEWLKTSFLWCH